MEDIKHVKVVEVSSNPDIPGQLTLEDGPEGWHIAPILYGHQLHTEAPDKLGRSEAVFTIMDSPGQDGSTPVVIMLTMVDGDMEVLYNDTVRGFNIAPTVEEVVNKKIDQWNETRRKVMTAMRTGKHPIPEPKPQYLVATHVYELRPGAIASIVTDSQTEADVPYEVYDKRLKHEDKVLFVQYKVEILDHNPIE